METVDNLPLQKWQQFLDTLDSTGGHIFLLSLAIAALLIAQAFHWQSSERTLGEFTGALLYALKGSPSK
jgi:hypothetical protein